MTLTAFFRQIESTSMRIQPFRGKLVYAALFSEQMKYYERAELQIRSFYSHSICKNPKKMVEHFSSVQDGRKQRCILQNNRSSSKPACLCTNATIKVGSRHQQPRSLISSPWVQCLASPVSFSIVAFLLLQPPTKTAKAVNLSP